MHNCWMPNHRALSDQELIDVSHHLRRRALEGSAEALFEARRHEGELRRRFGKIDGVTWGNTD